MATSTQFPPARRIATNGIELSVHEAGEGTPVLLLHGFPELAYSWRNQIGPIVDAGFRVIVPDMRGYGASDAPADSQSYSRSCCRRWRSTRSRTQGTGCSRRSPTR